MEKFQNAAVVWFVLGFVFFILEFLLPGFILFFFAVGAWVVAIASLVFDISLNTQLLLFVITSVLSIIALRKWVKNIMMGRKSNSEIEDEILGRTGKAETYIGPGNDGRIEFKGTSWTARSNESIQPGEIVSIVGNESILLIVKPLKNSA
ncbi:MAG: NfeD family protein [Bacteroidetes bacterium]|nr:NfeD family protein [Bacteroidota bacterium]